MARGRAVIGANYGDEGKGLMTDFFASQSDTPESCLVVRFNGGAQAGHTVTTPDGRRHVFSHFGAGSFVGAPTYLSRFFIVNPMVFVKELSELTTVGVSPQVFIDSKAMLTTPVDVLINQIIERRRGAKRHGSCGMGINETVTRCLRSQELLTRMRDIVRPHELASKVRELSNSWLPERLQYLGIDRTSAEWNDVESFKTNLNNIVEQYIADSLELLRHVVVASKTPQFDNVVFEGAQGLLLDEGRLDQWPHVTRSKTGLANIVNLANQMQVEHLDITYVTRSYLTRHGAGQLQGEEDLSLEDSTNIPNQYQGTIRFAKLGLKTLEDSVQRDLRESAHRLRSTYSASLAVTCLDQMPMPSQTIDIPVRFTSNGPTREHVSETGLAQNKGRNFQMSAHFLQCAGVVKQ